MLIQKYNYERLDRETIDGIRHYHTPDGNHVASVTTILDKTKPQETIDALENWRKRIGHKEAEQITNEAADRGTSMHEYLEQYCLTDTIGSPPEKRKMKPRDFLVTNRGYKMAEIVVKEGLQDLQECWAVEAPLYYSGLYAGTTDCCGVYENEPAIVDFKQSNKLKKSEWIDDYRLQLIAYALAHNNMYGTKIRKGVILMCTKDLQFQKFILEGEEWDKYMNKWWDRVDQYYK